ncbi:P1 family peptidase [Branchiibius sp. NY16-3462-2]|uniref:P1 family peptidase n=1 Tax=Branchiibius sp. NY16-3462-2 TaxID=1807500 RepID=UPI0025C091B0|nr:P1 family peptidase [Branchiibius sp. NY16-3462-2]
MAVLSEVIGVRGVRVGHWTDPVARTGCTLMDLPPGTVASAEVRGGAPASRELDALAPDKTVQSFDGVLLAGGSAFGLAAADGVMRFYAERGRGVPTPAGNVPVVPTLALFDRLVGSPEAYPDAAAGYAAAQDSASVLNGPVGAGTGACVSNWRGEDRRPGGLRYAEAQVGELVVGALCAVNAFGDIDPGTGPVDLGIVDALLAAAPDYRSNTTIGVVVTNAALSKTDCFLVAQGAHDGLARAVTPPHTRFDGDAFVAAATGEVAAHVDVVRLLAMDAVCTAIRAVG